MDLRIKVKEIKGICPVYNVGDTIVLKDGHILDTQMSASVCMHSLASILAK